MPDLYQWSEFKCPHKETFHSPINTDRDELHNLEGFEEPLLASTAWPHCLHLDQHDPITQLSAGSVALVVGNNCQVDT